LTTPALHSFPTRRSSDLRAGGADRPLRISYFGDSLTADDHITNELRHKLQSDLGDGGPGFVFAVPPHPFCQHRAVTRIVGGGWRSEEHTSELQSLAYLVC